MLDMSRLVPGPTATWMLADLGMDVLKIEDIEVTRGGRARDSFSPRVDDPDVEARAMAWNHIGRNKRSIAIDLKKPEGQDILHRLAKAADVFFGTFRLPVYERLGAGYEELSAINPRLIYCTLNGYGREGTFADWPGNERNAQGMSGVSALTTGTDGEPADFLFTVVDSYSAAMVVISIQAALMARERTGRGQNIDVALTEAGTVMANGRAVPYLRSGAVPQRGLPSLGNLKCKDGRYLASAASAQTHFWARFCDAIGRPQYKELYPLNVDRRTSERGAQIEAAIADVREVMMTKTRDEWLEIIPREISVTPLLEYDEAMESQFAKERGLVWELDHPLEGKVRQIGSPFHLSDTPPTFRNFAPMLGQDTEQVLREAGYDDAQIRQLEQDRVVRIARTPVSA
jgi:formyl-CoA transferase